MFTSIDKAITAGIMSALSLAAFFNFLPFEITDQTAAQIGTVVSVLTPLLTWLIPNRS